MSSLRSAMSSGRSDRSNVSMYDRSAATWNSSPLRGGRGGASQRGAGRRGAGCAGEGGGGAGQGTHLDARIVAISLRGTTSRRRLSHSSTPSSSSRRGTSASHLRTSSLPLRTAPPPPPEDEATAIGWLIEPAREPVHEPDDDASELRLPLPADDPRLRIGRESVGASASDDADDWREALAVLLGGYWGRSNDDDDGVGWWWWGASTASSTIGGVAIPRGRLNSLDGDLLPSRWPAPVLLLLLPPPPPKSAAKSGCC